MNIGLDVTVKYRFIHAVGDISTIANIDCGLARTVRQLLEEAANLIRARVDDLVGFPTGGAFAARLEIELSSSVLPQRSCTTTIGSPGSA